MEALVCGKWKLPLLEGKGGFFADMKPAFMHRRALCWEWLFEGMPEGMSVVSYFGGIGLAELIVKELLKPSDLHIYEIDEDCLHQLVHTFPSASVIGLDAHQTMREGVHYDVALIDHPYFTAKRWEEWDEELMSVFLNKPSYVELTLSVRRVALLKDAYSKTLSYPVLDAESYVRGVSLRMHEKYGYSVSKCAYHFSSAYMLLEPGMHNETEFKFFDGGSGVGFELQ